MRWLFKHRLGNFWCSELFVSLWRIGYESFIWVLVPSIQTCFILCYSEVFSPVAVQVKLASSEGSDPYVVPRWRHLLDQDVPGACLDGHHLDVTCGQNSHCLEVVGPKPSLNYSSKQSLGGHLHEIALTKTVRFVKSSLDCLTLATVSPANAALVLFSVWVHHPIAPYTLPT